VAVLQAVLAALNNGSSAITTTGTVSAGDVTVGDDVTVAGRASGHVTTDNDGSFDLAVGNDFKCTTAGGFTLTFTNPVAGQCGNIMFINGGNHAIAAHACVAISAACSDRDLCHWHILFGLLL